MMKLKKAVALCCALSVCGVLFSGCAKKEKDDYAVLERGIMEQTVTETGTVKFDDEYTVTSLVGGKILSANFEEGDSVKKDDVLYVIDDVDLKNQIAQTEISLEKAREANRQAGNASSDLSLYSKAAGLVTKVYVHKGDYVQPGTPICEVVESDYMKLTIPFSFPENANVYSGMGVKVIMTASGAEVSGTVSNIYASSQSFSGGRQGRNVEIKIKNPGALNKGDTAYAEIGGISSLSSGALENFTEQTVVAAQSGEVTKLPVSEGKSISVGTLVMQVKNDSITNSVSTSSLNVKDIETLLAQLRDKLDDYVIKAPTDGVIITKTAKESDIAAAGAPLAAVADTGRIYVNAEIDELYIKDIWRGQAARAVVQNGEGKEYPGYVRKISDVGTEKNGVTYYNVEIELEDTECLIEGMNMDVTVVTGEKETTYLPKEYVNGSKVTVMKGKKKEERTVKKGSKNDKFVEIIGGLSENEKVVGGTEK